MSDESPDKNREHIQNIKNELRNRGRILEILSFQTLSNQKWDCEISVPFWNFPPSNLEMWEKNLIHSADKLQKDFFSEYSGRLLDTQNLVIRETDIIAKRMSSHGSTGWWSALELNLVIECKSRTKENWIFLSGHTKKSQLKNAIPHSLLSLSIVEDSDALKFIDIARELLNTSHHHKNKLDRLSHVGFHVFGNYSHDSVRNACNQVLDALDFHYFRKAVNTLASYNSEEPRFLWTFYPIVLFDGPLFEAISTTDDVELNPIPWISFIHRYQGKKYVVDIVSWEFFDDYLSMLDDEFRRFSKAAKGVETKAMGIKIRDIDILKALPEFKASTI